MTPWSSTPASGPSTRSWPPCSTSGSATMADEAGEQPETDDGATRVGRPVIEKVRADERIMMPKGHTRGEAMSRGQRVVYLITWGVAWTLAHTYWRASIRGAENIPATGPFILSPVHRSNLDTPLAGIVTRRRL